MTTEQPKSAPEHPAAAPVQNAAAPETSKTPVWVWLLGGCFGLILLGMLVMGGLTWWAAHKIKQEFRKAAPKIERWQKEAEKMQEGAEKWQQEMEKIQSQLPPVPENTDGE